MTKKKFMQKLDKYIKDLPYDEKASVFMFYEEYFKDLGLEDDDEIPEDINPKKVANDILLEYGVIKKGKGFSSFKLFLITIGGIFSLPITIPMLILVFAGIVVAGALLISLFALLFSILTVPFYVVFSLIGTILMNIGNNLSIINVLASVLIIIGLLLIIYPIIKGIIKIFFKILSVITSKIYSWIYNKNEMKHENMKIELKKLDKIDLNNFDGNLKIKTKRKNWFNFGSKNSKIVIEYSKDMMNIDVNDAVGDVSIEMPQISNLNITDIVGDINIKSNGTVNILKKEDILGKVSFENITQSSNSSQKIKFSDVVGDINIF